jgi:hypothetical protein
MNVLTFLSQKDIQKFIDKDAYLVIEYLLRKVAFSQPEVKNKSELSGIQITKEFLEDWIAQACNLTKVGAGNYPIDVYSPNKYGIDVKFLTAKINKKGNYTNGYSNETSLSQNFKIAGLDLDQMFASKRYENILSAWIKILETKIGIPIKDYNLKKIYYFIFVRAGNKVSLAIADVNNKEIKRITTNRSTDSSVFVQNFIEDKYGNVKIYKSKKRMELRVFPKKLEEDKKMISWNFENLYPDVISLRDIIKRKEIDEHAKKQFKKFFK